MTTLVPGSHPLPAYPVDERRDYLCIVASIALADGIIDDVERQQLENLCTQFELGEGSCDQVIETARSTANLAPWFTRLAGSELRYALMIDLIDLAVGGDGDIADSENAELEAFTEALSITNGQLAMAKRFVLERRLGKEAHPSPDTLAGLAGVGVPVAALAIMAPLGAPLAAGLGLAAVHGVGSFVSVRWLARQFSSAKTSNAPSNAPSDSNPS